METLTQQINAVIGVWFKEGKTFYVKRSSHMENYPNAWSLMSIQFTLDELPDFSDIGVVQRVMERMSEERLGGVPIRVTHYLKSARCSNNPMNLPVTLHLYAIELDCEPEPSPNYYVDSAWFTFEEYMEVSSDSACGLCMKMWSDYCYQNGLSRIRFAPEVREENVW